MKRIEVIVEEGVEEEFTQNLRRAEITHYTRLQQAHGRGNKEPKMGDHIWPQTNALFIIYSEEEEARVIAKILHEMKILHPLSGIDGFISGGEWERL